MTPPTNPADLDGLRVFISYPRGGLTHTRAEEAERHLRAIGARVFRDETDIAEGDANAIASIERELGAADALAFFAGDDTADSLWQQREAAFAEVQRIAIVVVQTGAARPPFYLAEKQPVDARRPGWLPKLAQALARAQAPGQRRAQREALDPQRAAELAYLAHQIAIELWDRPARYAAVGAQHGRATSPQRNRRDLPFDVEMVFGLFGAPPQAPQKPYTDVLVAYRDLLGARQGAPRLVVLGDPGAGKSFSLERLFCERADEARRDPRAALPLLVALGDWTRAGQPFDDFLAARVRRHRLDVYLPTLRDQGRALLLLDGLNEIPVGQRAAKAQELFGLAQDRRWAGVVVSCRSRDFEDRPLHAPWDTLTLQPLSPPQVLQFLHRWALCDGPDPQARLWAEERFWHIAAGAEHAAAAAGVWQVWQEQGASWGDFWSAEDITREAFPKVYAKTSGDQDALWRAMRRDSRSLLRLAANPYWLTLLAVLPEVPPGKALLIEHFLRIAHEHEATRCGKRAAASEVPRFEDWRRALGELALVLQGLNRGAEDDSGAQTRLPRDECPRALDDRAIEFAIGAQVLRQTDGQLHFTHQLMQEALAAGALVDQSLDPHHPGAADYWPRDEWWQRSGWEVVAEFAAEALASQPAEALRFVAWLAAAQPDVAARVWRAVGSPALSIELRELLVRDWAAHLTNVQRWPRPEARAAIGRALAAFDLDRRPGIGLRGDGLPDIDWVEFDDGQPFVYQGQQHPASPGFAIARYPITHRQYETFVADGGYRHERWWNGLAKRFDAPEAAQWPDGNAPRETVSWFEAIAFCRWLTARLGYRVSLLTEQQWERVAAGCAGWAYPASAVGYQRGHANVDEVLAEIAGGSRIGRTTAVGIYPDGASAEGGVLDLAGNVWEWCLNAHDDPSDTGEQGDVPRVLRGGSWNFRPDDARASNRFRAYPDYRLDDVGFRVCRASPIGPLNAGATGR